jgi:nitrogen PTS system EIIA component
MDITNFLSPTDALSELRAPDKTRLLQELSRHAASALGLDADRVSADLLKREDLGSTGMGNGVAIPHARFAELAKPFGILARLKKAIAFDAIDAQPVDIVFLLLLPSAPDAGQLNALACVARKLRDPKTLGELRQAKDDAALYRAVVRDE